jgi:parallel beta-helix repeat protein
VRNCILTNFSVVVWGVTNNSRFENLEISNGVSRGISLDGENLTFSNITIHSSNVGLAGTMQFSEMSNIKVYSSNFSVDITGYNNTLSNSEFWDITSRAIGLQTGGNMSVENTIIRDSWGVGIWVDWESNGNTIDNVTIYNLPNDFPIYITSDNNMVKNSLIYNSYAGIGIHGNGDYDTLENIEVFNTSDIGIGIDGSNHVLRNLTVHSTKGISVWGSNHLLEDIETFDTTPESAGLAIHSENTILRNIYNHDEYRSTLDGTNNTLEYSRCENVEYGCWHIFGNNTTVRHSNFSSGINLFGSSYGKIYNNTIGGIDIYDWFGSGSFYNEIYNNYVSRYECGISLTNSSDNLIYNNIINTSQTPVCFGDTVYANQWNTSYQEGENIWNASLGYIGGNFWTNPDETGYSDTCHDSDADGFCDDPYVLATDNIDYLPIAKNVGQYPTPPALPAPRLFQLSPIAGILAYVLLPIVFAMVAQKYLLGEVELTLQGLIKYLLMFVMVIIIAIGFALVFSII